jgi:uncharacterized membrane protein YdjX (TVP38/TMEM64 family)
MGIKSVSSKRVSLGSLLQQHWQKLIALLIWGALLGCYFWYATVNNVGPIQVLLQLIKVMRNSVYGPLLYGLIYTLRPLAFFSAGLLTVAGGYLFGPVWGVVYTLVASNLSATVAYVIGRYFGNGVLDHQQTGGLIQRYALRLRQRSFETVLIMRLVLLPYDFVNYLCGFLRINYRSYLVASVLGSLPGTIAFVLFGASVDNIERLLLEGKLPGLDWRVLLASFVILAISIALSRYFRRQEGVEQA